MKRFIPILLSVFLLNGCVSSTIKDNLSSNAAKLDRYVELMEKDETTPEEDQDMIRVMRVWTWSMNWAANGETPPPDVRFVLESAKEVREDE